MTRKQKFKPCSHRLCEVVWVSQEPLTDVAGRPAGQPGGLGTRGPLDLSVPLLGASPEAQGPVPPGPPGDPVGGKGRRAAGSSTLSRDGPHPGVHLLSPPFLPRRRCEWSQEICDPQPHRLRTPPPPSFSPGLVSTPPRRDWERRS